MGKLNLYPMKKEDAMGKCCMAVLGIGLAGAVVGMHAYMFLEPKEQCDIKNEVKEALDDLRKMINNLTENKTMEEKHS